ncbi:MAG: transposase [Desulfobulbaceae bacterium DB1]|nr:MAG: transposase [Desulfobulbaceae bacterium DB1]
MQYRRANIKGGSYFFTVVTHQRRKILCEPENIDLLRAVFRDVLARHPFTIDAMVVLPDHLHCIWTLPAGDNDFSRRWRLIKGAFTRKCDGKHKGEASFSRQSKGEQAVWQRRFWEHLIRDEQDFHYHADYIHYNPVKHGLVSSPLHWPYSSFAKFVSAGVYSADWGADGEMKSGNPVGMEF